MSGSQVRQLVYFGLAAIGLMWTAYFNVQWLGNSALDHSVEGFVRAGFANSAASSLGADITIVSLAVWVLMVVEAQRLGMRRVWLYVAGSMVTATACMFPLFLAMRERKLAQP